MDTIKSSKTEFFMIPISIFHFLMGFVKKKGVKFGNRHF
jgi:hypothetical protein